MQLGSQAMIHHLAILRLTGPCERIRLSKLNSADHYRKYRKLHIRVCFARLSQIQLQQLFTGKESIVLKSLPAVVVLYFTGSEKDNLRTKSYSYKEQKLSQCTGKQNCVMKNEKNSDYYYLLSNRKMILSKLAGLLFPRKFNKRTSLFTLMRYITAIWFFDWRQR